MIIAGRIVSTEEVAFSQIRVEGDRVVEVGPRLGKPDCEFDEHCLIFPGMGDIHIHAREDASETQTYKEDFQTAAAAAVHGGVVHVADMPNNTVVPVDETRLAEKAQRLHGRDVPIHFTFYAGIGPGTRPLERRVPYKAFMGPSIGELYFTSLKRLSKRWVDCRAPRHWTSDILCAVAVAAVA